jgi:hypothetical protein
MPTDNGNFGSVEDREQEQHDNDLANRAAGLNLAEEGHADYDHGLANGNHDTNFKGPYAEEAPAGYTEQSTLGNTVPIGRDSEDYAQSETQTRPS